MNNCGTCLWNDDLLCDKKGLLIFDEESEGCEKWEDKHEDEK